MRHKHSDYMHWSKTQSQARFNLATSGVAAFPFRELPIILNELVINSDNSNSYGYAPLQQAIAARHGVDPDCVVESAGTSIANYLAVAACDGVDLDCVVESAGHPRANQPAMALIIDSADEVRIEDPAYEPILDIAQYLGANVKRLRGVEENGGAIDPGEVRRCIPPK